MEVSKWKRNLFIQTFNHNFSHFKEKMKRENRCQSIVLSIKTLNARTRQNFIQS